MVVGGGRWVGESGTGEGMDCRARKRVGSSDTGMVVVVRVNKKDSTLF